ncbi:DUF2268 domain-containing putative Zn-dependent protease [Bacillus sp. SG-1]|uniref:DUF2268 domain-containing putative Zn-dependent protease n=1 Tax=Bacillus sp. SG-1 TaxID=161544 RepID=UPI000311985C|nr:DUF2268 domain-containing putative Zn-dependent protease [Bacillus sp. SG-1]
MKRLLLAVTGCMILAGCTEKTTEPEAEAQMKQEKVTFEDITHSFEHPETGQSYQIIDAYKLYDNYISELEENPDTAEKELYQQEIIDPVNKACFEGGEFYHMAGAVTEQIPHSLERITELNQKIEDSQYIGSIKDALVQSSDLLPSDIETNVCIFPNINTNNAGAVTVGAGKINVLYSPFYTEDFLKTVIAHEYHHSVWAEKFLATTPQSVLDNLVFEGKAVMFEKVVYPDLEGTRVNDEYNKKYWAQIQDDLGKYDFNRSIEILFGGNGLPQLYGYMEGYKMVKSYLDLHPEAQPMDWTSLSGEEIFEAGKYADHYQ